MKNRILTICFASAALIFALGLPIGLLLMLISK